jgi:hypothetical protein
MSPGERRRPEARSRSPVYSGLRDPDFSYCSSAAAFSRRALLATMRCPDPSPLRARAADKIGAHLASAAAPSFRRRRAKSSGSSGHLWRRRAPSRISAGKAGIGCDDLLALALRVLIVGAFQYPGARDAIFAREQVIFRCRTSREQPWRNLGLGTPILQFQ